MLLCFLELIYLDELQKAEIVNTSKSVPSVIIKNITE